MPTVLRRAADEIEKRGLAKGNYFKKGRAVVDTSEAFVDPTVRCCALGAIRLANGSWGDSTPAADHFGWWLRYKYGNTNEWYSVDEWNDMKSRTKAQVIKNLRAAADSYNEESK